jgi:serine/threonine-protein kinase
MSPEQARGEDADHRADIYGLGAVMYRVLTGRPAFSGTDTPALLHAVVYSTPTRPSEINSVLSEQVDAVLAKAMAKSRGDRFATAFEFADALRASLQALD